MKTIVKKTLLIIMMALFVIGTSACKEETPSEKAAKEAEKTVEKAKKIFQD